LVLLTVSANSQQITEIHYDNTGTDANERVEITVPAGTNITGWNVILYNGSGGVSYSTVLVSTGTLTTEGGFDIYVISYAPNGIQNGAPDGVALVDASNTVLQFLSYEGAMTATNGPASGLTSTDILAFEDGLGTNTGSIQFNSATGIWTTNPTQNSFGALNALLLPFKVESFIATVNNQSVILKWAIAHEVGIVNYEIEKSNDGYNFSRIVTISAQNLFNYSHTDNSLVAGTSYYRLKINENGGGFIYSPVIRVANNGKNLNLNTIYPSPAKDFVKATIQYNSTKKGLIEIIGLNGKTVLSQQALFTNGFTEKTLNISNLLSGVYVLRVTINNETVSEKFIKQ
jgi:hypothetical protein